MSEEEAPPISYEELAQIEQEFEDIDVEMIRRQYLISAPLYAKRQAAIAKVPNFWPLVFEQAPPDIDQYIQPSDSEIFARCLTGLNVKRFEIPVGPEKLENDANVGGDPRSLCIRFEFAENEWFTDKVLEKKFWYRRSLDGWSGLVSEPVRVHWKKGKDMTQGLMDGAIKLWEARQKAGDMNKNHLPEFRKLAKIVQNWTGANTSFFTWFAFVSTRKWVSAEESAKATKEENEKRQKAKAGEKVDDAEPEYEAMEEEVEVHPEGEDIATMIAEDLWPGALKYFIQAQEDAEMSEVDFEDDSDLEDGDDDEEPVDLASLIQDGPPKKKQKK